MLVRQNRRNNLLLDALPDSACLAISSPLERIYDYQTGIPLVPGGTQKILTSYAAIKQLGASFQYETIIAAERETDEDGNLLSSDLYVFGGGDPLLRTDSYTELLPESYSQIRTSADELADLTVGMNVLFVQGAVVVNETRYDEERTVPGWSPELQESSVIGSLSAALLDGGYDGLKQKGYPIVSSNIAVDYAEKWPLKDRTTIYKSDVPNLDKESYFD